MPSASEKERIETQKKKTPLYVWVNAESRRHIYDIMEYRGLGSQAAAVEFALEVAAKQARSQGKIQP
jgi:hypothetical protein